MEKNILKANRKIEALEAEVKRLEAVLALRKDTKADKKDNVSSPSCDAAKKNGITFTKII